MSIFETFYLLFKADTTDIKKGSEEAVKETKKLNSELNNLDKISDIIGTKFLGIAGSIGGIFSSFFAARKIVSSISNGFKESINYDVQLGKSSRALGINAGQLDIWSRAVQQAGGNAQDFESSIRNLAEHYNTIPSIALQALPQLADNLRKVSFYSALRYGRANGLTDATILLLRNNSKELQNIINKQKELGYITDQDIERTTKYNQTLLNLKTSLRFSFNNIGQESLPTITKLLDHITNQITELNNISEKHKILYSFSPLLAILAEINDYFMKINNELHEMIDKVREANKIRIFKYNDNDNYLDNIFGEKKSIEISNSDLIHGTKIIEHHIKLANGLLKYAAETPLNYQTSNSISNSSIASSFSRNNTINTGPIEIITQANDAEGIAAELNKQFKYHLFDTSNFFADNINA